MKKFIVMFIAFIFVLAFIIGHCNDDTPDILCKTDNAVELPIEPKREGLSNKMANEPIINSIESPVILLDISEKILVRKTYTLSYNKETKLPNWVAWHLTSEHVNGNLPRDNNYYEDENVPSPRATNDDYRGSGWSRGHMCPAGDNKWDSEAMRESNLLTNICPQHASLNSGLWNVIERDCREWAKKYGEIYIVCGPVFLNKEHETIGKNKVVVPEAFFKVILRLNPQPAAIGFVVRNNEGKKKRDQYINTVDDVERITGIDFFPALPDSIENVVETYANLKDW
ncbi:MAG: DNA/RNA non-specific endonuclease [Prevotella sp.]|nr:DNA/RNA non-specific endonuclease [Prevotella sp.]